MCVITDENDVVVSVSLIPGMSKIPVGWHCYFPVDYATVGSVYTHAP